MIKNKKILITGGSSGLGKSLANKLLKNKNKVYCLGRSNINNLSIRSVKCNFKSIKNINKIKYEDLNEIFKINVFANKEILDFFVENKITTKLIIAISSGAALSPKIGWFLYCSSKAAFKFLIESYALEDRKRKFINISPGLIKTKMQTQICKIDEKKIPSVKKFKNLNKSNKVPSPDEVAENILSTIQNLNKSSGSYLDIRKK